MNKRVNDFKPLGDPELGSDSPTQPPTVRAVREYFNATNATQLVTVTGSGWQVFGGGWARLRVARFGQMATISGVLVQSSTPVTNEVIATLPEIYWPLRRQVMPVSNANGVARVDVTATGSVQMITTGAITGAFGLGSSWVVEEG